MREQLLALERDTEAPLAHQHRRGAGRRPGVLADHHGADVAQQARHRVQQGRLARAVRAEDGEHLAGLGGEGGGDATGDG